MERKTSIDALGGAVLIAFSALLGLNQSLVKLVGVGLAPAFQAGLRSALALLPVLIFAWVMRKRLSLRDGSLIPGLVCGGFFSVEFLLLFQALDYTTVSRASIFFYTMPVWVTIGAHFLIPGDRLTRVKALGLAIAVAGVALALLRNAAPETDRAAALAFRGDLMCLLAAVFWSGIALVARTTALSKSEPEMQLLYQLAVSAPVLLLVAWATGDTVRDLTGAHLAILAFQVIVVVCVGFLSWFWVLSIYPASDMASFGFLAPLFGVGFGWAIFDDPITWRLAGALGLVGLGIVLVNRRPRAAAAH